MTIPRAEDRPTIPLWPTVAEALGVGRSAVYEAARRGQIPGVIDLGRRRVVATAVLRRWLRLDAEAIADGATAPTLHALPGGGDGDL